MGSAALATPLLLKAIKPTIQKSAKKLQKALGKKAQGGKHQGAAEVPEVHYGNRVGRDWIYGRERLWANLSRAAGEPNASIISSPQRFKRLISKPESCLSC